MSAYIEAHEKAEEISKEVKLVFIINFKLVLIGIKSCETYCLGKY